MSNVEFARLRPTVLCTHARYCRYEASRCLHATTRSRILVNKTRLGRRPITALFSLYGRPALHTVPTVVPYMQIEGNNSIVLSASATSAVSSTRKSFFASTIIAGGLYTTSGKLPDCNTKISEDVVSQNRRMLERGITVDGRRRRVAMGCLESGPRLAEDPQRGCGRAASPDPNEGDADCLASAPTILAATSAISLSWSTWLGQEAIDARGTEGCKEGTIAGNR